MSETAVVIPYRAAEGREDHFLWVKKWYEATLPLVPVIVADSGHEKFNRGASRNQGVNDAWNMGYDQVVIADADTVPEASALYAALVECDDGRLHLPYNYFKALDKKSTIKFKRGFNRKQLKTEDETSWSTGGVLVMTVDAYQRTGGQPALEGWGFEDTIFRTICDAILGETKRHQGTIYHLWHPKVWNLGSPEYEKNAEIAARFNEAEGDPMKIGMLIQEFS